MSVVRIVDWMADKHKVQPPDPMEIALERAIQAIERELPHRLDLYQLIAVYRILDDLASDIRWYSRKEQW